MSKFPNNYEEWQEQERCYEAKARELTSDQSPRYNIAPLVDLIRVADRLGFDVVKHADGKCSMQPRSAHNTRGEHG